MNKCFSENSEKVIITSESLKQIESETISTLLYILATYLQQDPPHIKLLSISDIEITSSISNSYAIMLQVDFDIILRITTTLKNWN